MTIEEAVLEKVRRLPLNRKQEVLDFAEFLAQKENLTDEAIDHVFEKRKELLARLAEGVK